MPYPIWIGTNSNGDALIGARRCDDHGTRVEKVHGCQLRHRVVARMPQGGKTVVYVVCTPTKASRSGWEVVQKFHS